MNKEIAEQLLNTMEKHIDLRDRMYCDLYGDALSTCSNEQEFAEAVEFAEAMDSYIKARGMFAVYAGTGKGYLPKQMEVAEYNFKLAAARFTGLKPVRHGMSPVRDEGELIFPGIHWTLVDN